MDVSGGDMITSASGTTIAELMGQASTFLQWILSMVTQVIKYMVSEPIIMVFFLATLAGLAFTFFTKMWQGLRG